VNIIVSLVTIAVVLTGCSPRPPAADIPASIQGPPTAQGYLGSARLAERAGALPAMPWPKLQAGVITRANEAELAIIFRSHELHDRHPWATPSELAELLVRDDVWKQNAQFVQAARRAFVTQEALGHW
jgi:hypothetical protein